MYTEEVTLIEIVQPKRTPTISEKASQDGGRSEKGFDLTPMLNVLGARTFTTPDTVANKESDEEEEVSVKREHAYETVTKILEQPAAVEASRSRTLVVRDLPDNSDYTLVQSLIQGAVILKMEFNEEEQYARIKLPSTDDCQRVIEAHGSGKAIKYKGKTHKICFELSTEPDEQDDILDAYLECGATRAVAVEDIDLDVTMRALFQLGQGPTKSRVVEAINDSFGGGARNVVFRFISIYDAVGFRSSLRPIEGWRDKKAEFARDPCA